MMTKTKWDDLFGEEYYITITNEERRYLGLNPVNDTWEISRFYSKTNLWHKRTTIFWEENTIKKIIYEQKKVASDDGRIICHSIQEEHTSLATENREWLLPLTKRGKKKKVTATNIADITPFGSIFRFYLNLYDGVSHSFAIWNPRNSQQIEIGEWDKIEQIQNDGDFHKFMKYYMDTCSPDYFNRVERMRNSEHVTVKYQVGDVFRADLDRFHYRYGLITGKVREIQKWKELSENHSFRKMVLVPIMVRFYDFQTTDPNVSIEELSKKKLERVEICADGDILRGRHVIIGKKKLTEDDVEFNLVCTKLVTGDEHKTVFTDDTLISGHISDYPETFNLYVEWGIANVILPYQNISKELKEFLKDYNSPYGGVALGILPIPHTKDSYAYKNNLLNDINKNARDELFRCLGLPDDAGFDDLACKYGGLTKKKILSKLLQCENNC